MHTLTVHHDGGDRFVAAVRGHEIVFDQPEASGGTDTGPTPTEAFVAALAACVAFFGRRYLHRHDLPEDLSVSVTYTFADDRPQRIGAVELRVSPGTPLPERRLGGFQRVVEACTLHLTLEHPPEMAIVVLQP